jgi:hypothetical protein
MDSLIMEPIERLSVSFLVPFLHLLDEIGETAFFTYE